MVMSYESHTTLFFDKWLKKLRDRQAVMAILQRLDRVKAGHLGDVESVGSCVSEMRLFVGKGYRLYFTIQQSEVIFLLCGGDKSSQQRDIKKAKELAKNL